MDSQDIYSHTLYATPYFDTYFALLYCMELARCCRL